jgi:hypothetical protein
MLLYAVESGAGFHLARPLVFAITSPPLSGYFIALSSNICAPRLWCEVDGK